MLFSRK
jgi:hypothetical protein